MMPNTPSGRVLGSVSRKACGHFEKVTTEAMMPSLYPRRPGRVPGFCVADSFISSAEIFTALVEVSFELICTGGGAVELHSALALQCIMDNNLIILISHKQEAPLSEE